MKKQQYNKIHQTRVIEAKFSVSDLVDKTERTLLWGYTLDRDSFHVYLKDGKLNLYIYTFEEKEVIRFERGLDLPIDILIPSKRAYPEACDYEFCKILISRGYHIPFTTFNEARVESQFYGRQK